ncbi:hypothetical protein NSX50_24595, partial [Salmonella enterica]|nr:hypothetical protein [Salmonella enterica]
DTDNTCPDYNNFRIILLPIHIDAIDRRHVPSCLLHLLLFQLVQTLRRKIHSCYEKTPIIFELTGVQIVRFLAVQAVSPEPVLQ